MKAHEKDHSAGGADAAGGTATTELRTIPGAASSHVRACGDADAAGGGLCDPDECGYKNELTALLPSDKVHDVFVQFQAIVALFPKRALDKQLGGACRACGASAAFCTGGQQSTKEASVWSLSDKERVEVALLEAIREYPAFSERLRRLEVLHASVDLAIFADHFAQHLYTAARGTSIAVCRDFWNDFVICLGTAPTRVSHAEEEYRQVRQQFPQYSSFGTGHSLGGSVMHDLAFNLERDVSFAFARVDVFNAGGSPLRRRAGQRKRITDFRSHRVAGDLVSYFYEPLPEGETFEHEQNPAYFAHVMGNFLPPGQSSTSSTSSGLGGSSFGIFDWLFGGWLCCSSRPPSIS